MIANDAAAPDYYAAGGDFSWGIGQKKLELGRLVTEGEVHRFAVSAAMPDQRFHYRYVAADELVRAADLVPPRSQAFAALLCQATRWMIRAERRGFTIIDGEYREDPKANSEAEKRWHSYYARYVKQGALVSWGADFGGTCPAPDFDGAARLRWWKPWHDAGYFVTRHEKMLAAFVAALMLSTCLIIFLRSRNWKTRG